MFFAYSSNLTIPLGMALGQPTRFSMTFVAVILKIESWSRSKRISQPGFDMTFVFVNLFKIGSQKLGIVSVICCAPIFLKAKLKTKHHGE